MAKQDIKRLLDDTNSALESECNALVDSVRSDLKHFKTKTLDKISKSIP
jgi:hypothetical protein